MYQSDIEFKVSSSYKLSETQQQTVNILSESILNNNQYQTLFGVTGSGKTFMMAKIIEFIQKPTLIISHNKTLAAQLYREFKDFFPNNTVEYFVSYYDYYQPEAYVPHKDLYIEKDAQINEEIERLRISAMAAILQKKDVIIVATVSCIYGLGSPEDFQDLKIILKIGQVIKKNDLLKKLIQIQYERNEYSISPGCFRVKGDIIDIYLSSGKIQTRIQLFGDEIESIKVLDPINLNVIENLEHTIIYPAKAYVTKPEKMKIAIENIKEELQTRLTELKGENKIIEAQRLEKRTLYDLEMLQEIGFCKGIEHYSRHLALKEEGSTPYCLLNYFPSDFICFADESHITLPQFRGMSKADKSRKENLVEFGFRLPSALDNRPLNFTEFENFIPQLLHVSATPELSQLDKSQVIAEQIIRPTGLLDPNIEVRSSKNQFDNLIQESQIRIQRNERVIVTTVTKKLAESVAHYLSEKGLKTRYLHGDIETVERVEILTDLREGVFDILIGINLLREGLDLPEVSLICILDADKIGFLRSASSLIQIIGRAARNINGHVIMYADNISKAMQEAIDITQKRREQQNLYNEQHNINPKTIEKKIQHILNRQYTTSKNIKNKNQKHSSLIREMKKQFDLNNQEQVLEYQKILKEKMLLAAENMEFEQAAQLRDELKRLEKK